MDWESCDVILGHFNNVRSLVCPYHALSTYADVVGVFVGAPRPIMRQLLHVRQIARLF